jgi:DNA-binding CsgD family transcriptional regulator
MLTDLIYVIFLLSVAMASAGIVISTKLRSKHGHQLFSYLLYFQVFIYTFGFYGIWGQVATRAFLASYISADLMGKLSDLSVLMGLPFLVFAWLMLLQFAIDMSGRQRPKWFTSLFLSVNFIMLLVLAFIIKFSDKKSSLQLIKYCFIILSSLYSLAAALIIKFRGKRASLIHEHDSKIIAPALFSGTIVYCLPLLFYNSQIFPAIIFIFLFFAANIFLPFYFSYFTLLPAFTDNSSKELSFDDFCIRYDVSPRESDIVREICNGLSNKEISERLFISLQTVKDHTHHIYIKTNVRSRVQLINLVRDLKKS